MEPLIIKGVYYISTLEALEVMSHKYISEEIRHDIRDYFEAFLELCYFLEPNPQQHPVAKGFIYE